MRVFDNTGKPLYRDYIPGEQLPPGYSVEPFFPGYIYDHGKSLYWGEAVGEGGYVYAEPGMYGHVALLDIASIVNGDNNKNVVAAIENLSARFDNLSEAVANMKMVLDSGQLVGQIGTKVDKRLGVLAGRKERGNFMAFITAN